jgi:hypothetical protein
MGRLFDGRVHENDAPASDFFLTGDIGLVASLHRGQSRGPWPTDRCRFQSDLNMVIDM